MKRKYEFQSKTKGLTLQVEESGCPDTITLSVLYAREEVLALCLSRDDWDILRGIGSQYSSHRFDWTPGEVAK